MAEVLLIASLIASAVALGIVSQLVELFARLIGVPFGAVSWFLHGLGFLVMLPFVLSLMVLVNGFAAETWWVSGGLLAAALVAWIGGGVKLVLELVRGTAGGAARGLVRR
jgi:hypothetical protein